MDLIVLLVLIIIVIFVFRDVKWFIYLLGIIELFLRLVNYIGNNIGLPGLADFVNDYLPGSIFEILGNYSTGLLYDVLVWLLVACFVGWLIYLIRYFFRKK